MKKYFSRGLIFSLFFILISIISINCYAEDNTWSVSRSGIGVRESYLKYDSDFGMTFDDAIGFGINYTYIVDYYISFELSADYIKTDVSSDAGEMTQIPILLSGRFHPYVSDRLTPYWSAGLGFFLNHIDTNKTTAESLYGPGARIDVSDSFAGFVGGGIEFFLSKNVALNLDLKYIWTQVKGTVDAINFSEEYDIDPFVAGLGFKYYF